MLLSSYIKRRDGDNALVGRAAEGKVRIAESLDKRSVYHSIDIAECTTEFIFVKDLLDSESGVEPDIMMLKDYTPAQLDHLVGMIKWVTAGESDVKILFPDDIHDLVDIHILACVEIPRLRIMAAGTFMTASRKIDGGPETRTIHCSASNYVEYSNLHDMQSYN